MSKLYQKSGLNVQQSRFILSEIFEPFCPRKEVWKEMFGSKEALKHAYHTVEGKVFFPS